MIPAASNFKINNVFIAILIVFSTQHLIVYRVPNFIYIMLFDLILLMYVIFFFRSMLVIHLDGWLKLFVSMLFFQLVHNIFFSSDLLFVIKELVQGIELLIFYIILRKCFSNQNNLNKVIDYVFYGLCLYSFITVLGYFGTSITVPFGLYIKQSSVINMLIPIFILSFYYFKNYNSSQKKRILFFLIAIISCYLGILSDTRAFYVFLLLICLSYLFNFKKILLVTTLLIGILFIAFSYQDNISKKYTSEYSEKVSQTIEYITSDKPFDVNGYSGLMIIESPSNRQRLHFLKLVYQVGMNNLFTGVGSKQVSTTNLHGNIFIYFTSYGLFYLLLFVALILNLYSISSKNLKVFPSPLNRMKYFYLLYSICWIFFVSAGTFPLLPFIIAAALIKSKNEQRYSNFNNIGSSAY